MERGTREQGREGWVNYDDTTENEALKEMYMNEPERGRLLMRLIDLEEKEGHKEVNPGYTRTRNHRTRLTRSGTCWR